MLLCGLLNFTLTLSFVVVTLIQISLDFCVVLCSSLQDYNVTIVSIVRYSSLHLAS